MKKEDILKCSFSNWYPIFETVTVKSCIIPLPKDFVEYLLADGIILPETASDDKPVLSSGNDNTKNEGDSDDDTEANATDWSTADQNASKVAAPSFPDLEKVIKDNIEKLGGKVFPKLNWSSPKDAVWMSFDRTLKCTCPGDIYLLLKSSDFITHDLTEPFLLCDDHDEDDDRTDTGVGYNLVLREWHELSPGMEFRCFVYHNKLVAISQRDCLQYFEFLLDMKDEIVFSIKAFFNNSVAGKFPSTDIVFDVYRKSNGTLWLIDFNPFGPITDSLMFTWEQIMNLAKLPTESPEIPEFRCLEGQTGVQSGAYSSNAVPRDISDMSTPEGFDRVMYLMRSMQHGQSGYDSDSESNYDSDFDTESRSELNFASSESSKSYS